MSLGGSILDLKLDGVGYEVPGDADFEFVFPTKKLEGKPTSGETLFIASSVIPESKGPITVSPAQIAALTTLAERLTPFPMSVKTADGSVFRGTGRINFEKWTTMENKADLTLIPAGRWTVFAAA
jgi:hypothetical protein